MVRNLMFSDTANGFRAVLPNEMSYKDFLGKPYGPSDEAPMKVEIYVYTSQMHIW